MLSASVVPLAVGLALLVGCAPAGAPRPVAKPAEPPRAATPAHGELPIWRLTELVQATQAVALLRGPAGASFMLDMGRAKRVHAVAMQTASVTGAGEIPDWLLVGTPAVNAFATWHKGQPVIAITLGMMQLLKDDEGAWAALIGHEMAHFRLGHHQARQARKETVELGSSLAGLLLSAVGLGIGGIAADATGTLVDRAFSRGDERDADRVALDYVRRAGFDPQGALRLQQRLLELRQDSAFGFLSTHPGGQDRVEAMRRLLEQAESERGPANQAPN